MSLNTLYLRFRWLHAPAALLAVLLQRTPALRVATQVSAQLAPQTAHVIRSVFALGALGAYQTVAGATSFKGTPTAPTTVSPASGPAKTAFSATGATQKAFQLSFSVSGAPGTSRSWKVSGTVPPGLSVTGGTKTSTTTIVVNSLRLAFAGTPTKGGRYPLTITAYDKTGAKGNQTTVTCTVTVKELPKFTTQPASKTVTAGANVTFTAKASGYPAPTYQWYKGTTKLTGKTASSLTLTAVGTSAAGKYTVKATNSSGTVTSTAATLTVNLAPAKAVATRSAPEAAAFNANGPRQTFTASIANIEGCVYAAAGLPAWADVDVLTGVITGTPTTADLGDVPVTLTALDALGHELGVQILLQVR